MPTLGDLITSFRERATDQVKPYLWSDDDLARFASEAQREAALRSRLIRDSATASIREIDVAAGASDLQLSALVLDIERARIEGKTRPLAITSVAKMDDADPEWESATDAEPTHLVIDRGAKSLRALLYPPTAANVTVLLTVIRLPLVDLTDADQDLEFGAEHAEALVDWMLHKAYLKPDAETLDKNASSEALDRFVAHFGVKESADVLRKRAERAPSTVMFNDF